MVPRAASVPNRPCVLEALESRLLLSGSLYISEFMAINNNTLPDEDGQYSDWIEVHNAGVTDVNLENWALTDNASQPEKWRFPAETLPAGGYLVVFASNKDRAVAGSELHTNFQLSGSGEYLALVRPDGTVEHEYSPSYPPQAGDVSYGMATATTAQTILPAGVEAKYVIPTGSLGTTWSDEIYDDSGWTDGAAAVGYDNLPIAQPGGTVVLVEAGVAARGFVPTDGLLGTTWTGLGFTPADWLSGTTGLGFDTGSDYDDMIGDGLDVQDLMYNQPSRTSAYLRVEFQVSDPTHLSNLILQMKYDDGFVAWINGTKVQSANAPSTPLWNSAATAQSSEPITAYSSYDVSAYLGSLVVGTNVLAVQALNRTYNSSDLLVLPRLQADVTIDTYAYDGQFDTDVEAEMAGHNPAAYLRIPFLVEGSQLPTQLTLKMKYDDGFVAWINGTRVASRNAPTTPLWNSAATADRPDSAAVVYEVIDISSYISSLHLGGNVLAIQGLNVTAGDSDFLICPEMEATWTQTLEQLQRYFTVPTPGAPNGLGSADLGPIITDVAFGPQLPTDGQDITLTAHVRQAFSPILSVTMKYRVNFGSEVPLTMYDDGAHGDEASGDGMYGAVIPAGASAPGQMVRFYLTAQDATTTSRWPLWDDRTGGRQSSQYLGTVVQDDSYAATQLPVFHFFVQSTTAADSRIGTRGAVFYLGELYDNVFIRERGGTINGGIAEGAGQSRKIEFNDDHRFLFDPGQPRVGEINVNAPGPQDGSYLRQVLSFWLYDQAGQPGDMTFLMHVRQNGAFMGVRVFHDQMQADTLKREGLDEDGALYYAVSSWLTTSDYANCEQKNPKPLTGDKSDLQALADDIDPGNPDRHTDVMDNLNLAALVNYLAVEALIQDGDCTSHNYYVYRDPGTGEWMYIGHDRDLTWGDWVDSGADWGTLTPWGEKSNYGDRYWMHPFFGSSEFPHPDKYNPSRPQPWREWTRLTDAIHDDPVASVMFYRRLRTLMDEFLKPPGTPYAELPIEQEIDWWVSQLAYERANNLLPTQGGTGGETGKNFTYDVNKLKNYYIAGRRNYLYGALGPYLQMVYGPAWVLATGQDAAIPAAQPAAFAGQIQIVGVDADPASGNQDEEYIQLFNPNAYAVDISGWRLCNAVNYVFPGGTVIVPGGSLYVTPDSAAFRARATGPSGGQGLFVQGGYEGHLAADGETIWLLDGSDNLIATQTIQPTSVVINELLSHSNGPEGDWIELYNPTAAPVDISGWYLSDDPGVPNKYRIPDGTVLVSGQYVVFNESEHFGSAFAFSKNGDEAVLSAPGGTVVDSRDFGAAPSGVTFGRYVTTDGSTDFSLLSAATPDLANAYPQVGPVVISEIMYHPAAGGDEYIELHNITDAPVALYDAAQPSHTWTLTGGVDYTFPTGLEIPAHGFVVVTGTDLSGPGAEEAFRARNDIPAGVTVLGPFLGQLDNAGETVRLNRPGPTDPVSGEFAYLHVDRIDYDDDLPWPAAADGAGPALERLTYARYGNESGNWLAVRVGGTAGRHNTMYGDADSDGRVAFDDYQVVESHFGTPSGATWADGDFDGDGDVDFTDYQLLEPNFGAARAVAGTPAPALLLAAPAETDGQAAQPVATPQAEDSLASATDALLAGQAVLPAPTRAETSAISPAQTDGAGSGERPVDALSGPAVAVIRPRDGNPFNTPPHRRHRLRRIVLPSDDVQEVSLPALPQLVHLPLKD